MRLTGGEARGHKGEKETPRWGGGGGQEQLVRSGRNERLTCGEVDVGEEDDVGRDQRHQLGHADLLLEVDVDHVVVAQAAVGRWVKLPEAGAEAAQEPGRGQNAKMRGAQEWGKKR